MLGDLPVNEGFCLTCPQPFWVGRDFPSSVLWFTDMWACGWWAGTDALLSLSDQSSCLVGLLLCSLKMTARNLATSFRCSEFLLGLASVRQRQEIRGWEGTSFPLLPWLHVLSLNRGFAPTFLALPGDIL